MGSYKLEFVDQFRYLRHIITNDLNDDEDIRRELRGLFVRANVLTRRFAILFKRR